MICIFYLRYNYIMKIYISVKYIIIYKQLAKIKSYKQLWVVFFCSLVALHILNGMVEFLFSPLFNGHRTANYVLYRNRFQCRSCTRVYGACLPKYIYTYIGKRLPNTWTTTTTVKKNSYFNLGQLRERVVKHLNKTIKNERRTWAQPKGIMYISSNECGNAPA